MFTTIQPLFIDFVDTSLMQDIPGQFSVAHYHSAYVTERLVCVQLLMELQKVAFKADDDAAPIHQSLSSFAAELGSIVDKQLKVSLHAYT